MTLTDFVRVTSGKRIAALHSSGISTTCSPCLSLISFFLDDHLASRRLARTPLLFVDRRTRSPKLELKWMMSMGSADGQGPSSRTRSKPNLKRKGADSDKGKGARPRKVARTNSSAASIPPSVPEQGEAATGWPTDVPRSMLSSFRVTNSPFQACNASGKTVPDPSTKDVPMFASTGPEPMFDHLWRLTFVERPPTSIGDPTHHPVHPEVAVCAPSDSSPDPPCMQPVPAYPSAHFGPVLRRISPRGDENSSPVATVHEVAQHPDPCTGTMHTSAQGSLLPLQPSLSRRCQPSDDGSSVMPPTANLAGEGSLSNDSELPPPAPWMAHIPTVPPPFLPMPPVHPYPLAPDDSLGLSVPMVAHSATFVNNTGHLPPYVYLPPPPSAQASSAIDPQSLHHAPYPPMLHAPPPFASDEAMFTHSTPGSYPHAISVPAPYFHAPPAPSLVPVQPSVAYAYPSQPTSTSSTPWCTFFDTLKKGKGKGKAKAKGPKGIKRLHDELAHDPLACAGHIYGHAQEVQMHQCPFCPRTFALANSLAIHLKWHWGASGLDWKKGINANGKGIERVRRDAEKRREESDRLQSELEQAFASEPIAPGERELPAHEPTSSAAHAVPAVLDEFSMPVIAQSSFGGLFDFSFAPSQAGLSSLFGGSDTLSPASSSASSSAGMAYAFPPLTSAHGLATEPSSGSSTGGSVPRTPELSADSGSSNAASAGSASPTWSQDLFGGEDEDEDGKDGMDGVGLAGDDDLFGDGAQDLYGHGEEDLFGDDATTNLGTGMGSGSEPNADHLHLLPPALVDDDGEETSDIDEDEEEMPFYARSPRPFPFAPTISDPHSALALSPLDELVSVQTLPALDALERLSLT
ncbi:hypothetical protein C8Q76DRAFT_856103 [Earliella scabrosa]|nr:hypothetical protein C8Q76DRAFT_856103 [Earliella scabrosa]